MYTLPLYAHMLIIGVVLVSNEAVSHSVSSVVYDSSYVDKILVEYDERKCVKFSVFPPTAVFRVQQHPHCGAAERPRGRKRVQFFEYIFFRYNSAALAQWAAREMLRMGHKVTKHSIVLLSFAR